MRSLRLILTLAALAACPPAWAGSCTIDLDSNDQMRFDKASVTVSASCETITINLAHSGTLPAASMGHNVVIAATDVWQAVAQDGMKAGPANGYVPSDERVIAHTGMIGGGETTSTTFPGSALQAGTAYTFFCTFPGHWALMKGDLVVE